MAFLNPEATNAVLGVNQIFGGNALGLAEVMAPAAEDAVIVAIDKEPGLMTEVRICQECATMNDINLARIMERSQEQVGA